MLVGRDDALDLLRRTVDGSAGRSALLVLGEPGAGKTALLQAAVTHAKDIGFQVLRAAGPPSHRRASLTILDELLGPLLPEMGGLDPDAVHALRVCLGLADGPHPRQLLLGNAVLGLLSRAGRVRPLLLALDDTDRLDQASAQVLAFVGRRLTGAGVVLLAAAQPCPGSPLEDSGMAIHRLGPLNAAAVAVILHRRWPALAAPVRDRLIAEADGNPLTLLAMAARLTPNQQAGVDAFPSVLPLGDRLGAAFADRISELPAGTRDLLVLAALQGCGEMAAIQAAAPDADLSLLAPAERAGLLAVDGLARRFTFRHPSIPSTVVARAGEVQRRRAHRALAAGPSVPPERRAWHLADATLGCDEEIAGLLDQVAAAAVDRGDAAGAATALIRAAELSPAPVARTRRLLEAAYLGAEVTGDLYSASTLLARARAAEPDLVHSLAAAVAASQLLLNAETDIDTAHRVLVAAIDAHPARQDADDPVVIDAMYSLLHICWISGRAEMWAPFDTALARLTALAHPALRLAAATLRDPVRLTAVVHMGQAAAEALDDELNPIVITRVALGCVYLDRLSACRPALSRVIADGRRGGAVALAIHAIISTCHDYWLTGRWSEADRLAAEGVALSETKGYHRYALMLNGFTRSLVAAARGATSDGIPAVGEMEDWAHRHGAGAALQFAHHVRVLIAIGESDYETAYREATAISPPGALAEYAPHALWVLFDVVEAAMKTGRIDEAQAHVRAMDQAGLAGVSARLALVHAGCLAMVAPDSAAEDAYERALAVPDAGHWPFDLARIQLAYGEHLRRMRAPTASRTQLRAALATFERLSASPWARRAAGELRAGGHLSAGAAATDLTAQERRIAILAASGLSNKEIGRRLHLSHRTIGAHLYRLFPKLGVASRTALGNVVEDLRDSA
jgi:DNA-binding CsgD family transcriptional regulator